MKVTYFVTLLIVMNVAELHINDTEGICNGTGGFPNTAGTVCCRGDCKTCNDEDYCGHNGGNPWCCTITIMHNHGECSTDGMVAPCIRNEIRLESGGFIFAPSGEYSAVVPTPEEPANDVGWSSTGFVVQLKGIIKYDYISDNDPNPPPEDTNPLQFLARASHDVGKLITGTFGYNFCPITDQTFSITNKDGLSVSILVTKQCEVQVEAWALHVLYWDAEEHQFRYVQEINATRLKDGDVGVVINGVPGDPMQLIDMAYFDLAGVTYIGNYIKMVEFQDEEKSNDSTNEEGGNINLIYGLYIWIFGITICLILCQFNKWFNDQKRNNSPYGKVQVYLDDSTTQITDIDIVDHV